MTTRQVTAHTTDLLAIRSLLDRYTNGVNQRDWAAVRAVFTDDGVWDAGGPEMGHNAMRFEGGVNCAQGIAGIVSPMELCVQSNHAPVIHVDGDHATAVSTINEMVLAPGAPGVTTIWGTYYDDIVRDSDGEWRFRLRKFRFTWIDAAGAKGQVLARFPLAR